MQVSYFWASTYINTHKGLYRYTRLPFGIASAPAVFQRTMDTILQGVPNVLCYLDDILITGLSEAEHLRNLEEVLKRLQQHGIRVKANKCAFEQDSVEYLGHVIDKRGLHTSDKKVKAIQKAPAPKNPKQLKSFLGLLHYYGKFVPNLSTLIHPMNELLLKNAKWHWSKQCEEAFVKAKGLLSKAPILAHYDPSLPVRRLAGDASAYGIGVVISHIFPNGDERPIAYASHTLSNSEKNYAQLEREALSLIYGVQKFHQYFYGRSFVLYTDHKPLTTILNPKKGIPPLSAARLKRWAVILSAYNYKIEYKSTQTHSNADGLSRLPLVVNNDKKQLAEHSIFNLRKIENLPVTTATQLKTMTRRDPVLSKVLHYTKQGWPTTIPIDLKPYWMKRTELAVEDDCLMWGIRVIVPAKLKKLVLQELHQTHIGMVRMKMVARSYVWWTKLDKDIEQLVKSCSHCQAVRNLPPIAPLHPWIWPAEPWKRIHIDFAGPFCGRSFLVVVDSYSK